MNLLEAYMKDEVFVDFGSEPMFGSDQAYISYPIRFATVEFQLMATNGLTQIADRIRKDMGMRPMHPMDEYTDDTCDNEGWYQQYESGERSIRFATFHFACQILEALGADIIDFFHVK